MGWKKGHENEHLPKVPVCPQCGNHVPSEGHDETCDFHPDSLAHAREHDS